MSECESGSCGHDHGAGLSVSAVKKELLLILISAIAVAVEFIHPGLLPVSLAWVAVVLCGFEIVVDGLKALVHLDFRADVLVTIAVIASVVVGEIMAAAEICIIMSLGEMLETWTVSRARAGIQRIVDLTPDTARRMDADGEEKVIPVSEVEIGDMLRILPGEKIPVDGVIETGNTSVDSSVVTGESVPLDLYPGEKVVSGMVNLSGAFVMKAEKTEKDSSVQRMIELVRDADARKAKIVGVADRWSTWIVAAAVLSSLAILFVTHDVIRAVTILVVFCPCGLVLATPTAITAAIGNLTHKGVLVREGDALERLASVSRVAFDKTGTVTVGKPSVREVVPTGCVPEDRLLEFAAAVEYGSEHPIGRAICAYGREKNVSARAENFLAEPGLGISADVDGSRVMVGNIRMLRGKGIALPEDIETLGTGKGYIIVHAAVDGEYAGYITLSDTVREGAGAAIRDMREIGYVPVMLTGDRREAADSIAKELGITDVVAECTPEDKLKMVADFEAQGTPVCMVGDGVNDAPALKRARVGIAMGGVGSDIAVDAADIVLTEDGIDSISHMLALSKRTMQAIKWSMALSMSFNIGGIILAAFGMLNPLTGALVHNAGAFIAIANGAALLRWHLGDIDDYEHMRMEETGCSCCSGGKGKCHDEHCHDPGCHDEHCHDEHCHDEHCHDEHCHDEHCHDEHCHDEHCHDEHCHDEHHHDEIDEHCHCGRPNGVCICHNN